MNIKNFEKNILYEDNHIIVILKEPNIPVQEDITQDQDLLNIVKEYIKIKYNKPGEIYLGLLHRLDRVVGGIIIFAKTSKAASKFSELIRNKAITRKYLAVVKGNIFNLKENLNENNELKKDENEYIYLEDFLYKDSKTNKSFVIKDKKEESKNVKKAILKYKPISYNHKNKLSLIEVELITGRHHQIRVQFSSRKYPLLGDSKYGGKQQKNILLFSYNIGFNYPINNDIYNKHLEFKTKPIYELTPEFQIFSEEIKRLIDEK